MNKCIYSIIKSKGAIRHEQDALFRSMQMRGGHIWE